MTLLRTVGFDPPPIFRAVTGAPVKQCYLGTHSSSLPNGISFRLRALAGYTSVTVDRHTDEQTTLL